MADDRQVLREIWDGRVPVCLTLSESDMTTVSPPEPLYLLLPRLTYFPLVMDKVRRHFSRSVCVEIQSEEPWLECNGSPLTWHQPIGLQFDLLGSEAALPWCLTVHFSHTDCHDLSVCASRETLESFFISTLKEADQMKHRGHVMSQMSRRDQNQLWAGLVSDKFDQFWSVNRRLMQTEEKGGARSPIPLPPSFRSVPVRVYVELGKPFIQRAVSSVDSGDTCVDNIDTKVQRPLLFGAMLQRIMTAAGHTGDCHLKYRFMVHGIEPPLDTPALWLSQHLSYADNFLHIVADARC